MRIQAKIRNPEGRVKGIPLRQLPTSEQKGVRREVSENQKVANVESYHPKDVSPNFIAKKILKQTMH